VQNVCGRVSRKRCISTYLSSEDDSMSLVRSETKKKKGTDGLEWKERLRKTRRPKGTIAKMIGGGRKRRNDEGSTKNDGRTQEKDSKKT